MKRKFPAYLDLGPFSRASGTVQLPGSKSISNRVLLLAALADGNTEIGNLLVADDVQRMCEALTQLGVPIDRDADAIRVAWLPSSLSKLRGGAVPWERGRGHLRPLTAALALNGGDYTLPGVPRMHERPIGDLVDALRAVGARHRYTGEGRLIRRCKIRRRPNPSRADAVRGNVSSQFLTALLMALPHGSAQDTRTIEVVGELISKPYIEITLNLMQPFRRDGRAATAGRVSPAARQRIRARARSMVEGDASSASYFLAAGAIRRRAGAGGGRGPRQHPGRRALRRGAGARWARRSSWATTGSKCARRAAVERRSSWTSTTSPTPR